MTKIEIPDWHCRSTEANHGEHFWSDGIMGFECPGGAPPLERGSDREGPNLALGLIFLAILFAVLAVAYGVGVALVELAGSLEIESSC